jgi:hypothetical protein
MNALRLVVAALLSSACTLEPRSTAPATTTSAQRRPTGCREDIPDCVAACALRETSRTSYVEWFDERCAAAILGRNPDVVAGTPPPPPQQGELLDTR